MEKNPRSQLFENLPLTVESSVKMTEANQLIKIYEGEFELRYDNNNTIVNGEINFEWFPSIGVVFKGTYQGDTTLLSTYIHRVQLGIYINGLLAGTGGLTDIEIDLTSQINYIEGKSYDFIKGEHSIPVEKIVFSIPNFTGFFGSSTKKIVNGKIKAHKNRLTLNSNSYIIHIDQTNELSEKKNSLDKLGGYYVFCHGEIKKVKGSITLKDLKNIIECLNNFLSFINGRRTSILFLEGIYSDVQVWCDYSAYFVESYKSVPLWCNLLNTKGINELWEKFCELWANDKDFLRTVIHWYVQTNSLTGLVEGSLLMAQTNLELIYNYWIVEKKKLILGKDSENINAANKIRLLLSQISIDANVPSSYTKLAEFVSTLDTIKDAPEAIVQIRNAIVHSQAEKRKKLADISISTRWQALNIFIWYFELAFLRLLNFNEKYLNRTEPQLAAVQVPWVENLIDPVEQLLPDTLDPDTLQPKFNWPEDIFEDPEDTSHSSEE